MNPLTIAITAHGRCQLTQPSGRVYLSTPHAVALALLHEFQIPPEAATQDVQWIDLLATHGVLCGVRGATRIDVVILPRKVRSIIIGSQPPVDISYPPTLLGLVTTSRRFTRGMIMLADVSRQAQMGVLATPPVLVPFPFGNVYAESGYICWGTVPHADIHNLHDLEATFFGSGFNSDLWNGHVAGIPRLTAGELPTPSAAAYTTTFPVFLGRLLREE